MGNTVGDHRGTGGEHHNDDNCCADCSTSFKLICRRRIYCSTCMSAFCNTCMLISDENQTGGRRRQRYKCCRRCRVFTKVGLTHEDLMRLKPRDLLWYFREQNVRPETSVPKEKEELAQWILQFINREGPTQVQQQRNARLLGDSQEEPGPFNHNAEDTTGDPNVAPNNTRNSNEQNCSKISSSSQSLLDIHKNDFSVNGQDTSADNNGFVAEYDVPNYPSSEALHINHSESLTPVDAGSDPTTSQPYEVTFSNTQRVTLSELTTEAAVDQLSVKQLKDLLASNFVDYKGCCEKEELRLRGKRLWNSNLANTKLLAPALAPISAEDDGLAATTTSPEAPGIEIIEECKVCMDAPVDCVFLECGHMVTCVTCGKQMNECPICRQYIVRAVRIFRS